MPGQVDEILYIIDQEMKLADKNYNDGVASIKVEGDAANVSKAIYQAMRDSARIHLTRIRKQISVRCGLENLSGNSN